MRLILINLVTVGLLLFSAASASAVSLFFGAPSSDTLQPGESFTITFRLNTEGETNLTSVFASVFADPNVLAFVSGSSPGGLLNSGSPYYNTLGRVSQAFVLGSDPAGQVRAASFAALEPTGTANANQLLTTLTFQAVGAGTVNITNLIAQGDDITVNGVSIIGQVGLGQSASITVVPEPTTALLMGLGLAGLAAAGRRQA